MVNAQTVSMMVDSVCIVPPLLHALAEAHIANRNNKKCDRQYCEKNVLHKLSPKAKFSANIAGTLLPLKTGNPPQ